MIRNDVTYTTLVPDGDDRNIWVEQKAVIDRPQRLTRRGAERIMRAETGNNKLVVHRVETMVYA